MLRWAIVVLRGNLLTLPKAPVRLQGLQLGICTAEDKDVGARAWETLTQKLMHEGQTVYASLVGWQSFQHFEQRCRRWLEDLAAAQRTFQTTPHQVVHP